MGGEDEIFWSVFWRVLKSANPQKLPIISWSTFKVNTFIICCRETDAQNATESLLSDHPVPSGELWNVEEGHCWGGPKPNKAKQSLWPNPGYTWRGGGDNKQRQANRGPGAKNRWRRDMASRGAAIWGINRRLTDWIKKSEDTTKQKETVKKYQETKKIKTQAVEKRGGKNTEMGWDFRGLGDMEWMGDLSSLEYCHKAFISKQDSW